MIILQHLRKISSMHNSEQVASVEFSVCSANHLSANNENKQYNKCGLLA